MRHRSDRQSEAPTLRERKCDEERPRAARKEKKRKDKQKKKKEKKQIQRLAMCFVDGHVLFRDNGSKILAGMSTR